MKPNRWPVLLSTAVLLFLLSLGLSAAQGPVSLAFTYQGYLTGDDAPIHGACDFQFTLWDDPTAGQQVGPLVEQFAVPVGQGRFTTRLDFGPVFDGTALWLQVAVRCGDPDYTVLAPRQALTAAPYALHAVSTGALRGQPLSGAAPAPGQVLEWDGANWTAGTDDDTTYSAGAGLVLSSTVFSADTTYLQRRVAPCGAGYAIRAVNQDGSVVCALVDNTTYDAGFGLLLSGTTFLADPTVLQQRINATCGAGSAIRQVNPDGSVVCELDDDTTYSAGTGLLLTGTTFFPDETYLQRRVAPCGAGYAIQSVNQDGSVVCQVVDNTTYDAGIGLYLSGTTFGITTTYRLPQGCGGTEIPKWNGTVWACAADENTTYTAGTGLTLTGTQFSILASYQLPQTCGSGEIAEWNGTAWNCGADDNTTYQAGNQLTLTGTTFDVIEGAGSDLDADLLDGLQGSAYQWRVGGSCPAGSSIRVVNTDGTVVCEPDDDTTYSAGTGLLLTGTTFLADETYLQRRVAPCGAGYAIQAVNQDGSVVCQVVDNTTYDAGIGLFLAGTTFGITTTYRLPQSCAGGEIAAWDGAAWVCAADAGVTDHGLLSGLGDDDHLQYVHVALTRTITARHTFDPAFPGSPFLLGANAAGQLVADLNADLLDGYTTGSASGNIPVNDGALNIDLNADLLDGRHATDFALDPHDHWGETWSGSGTGLTLSSSSGSGLNGSGTTYGLYGAATTSTGYGVYGVNNVASTSSIGVRGQALQYGVYGVSTGIVGRGVYGYNSQVGYGVYGQGGVGVYGTGSTGVHGDGSNTGVTGNASNWGVVGSAANTGVYGSGQNYGLYGYSAGLGRGVYGVGATGVYGVAYNGGNYAGYFSGNVVVTGSLWKGGGGFKIDDPRAPANGYLYHFFVESAEMKNVYDGVVTLDQAGASWVELPGWFETINTEYRYQLTPIGAAAPNLYIAAEIEEGRFWIAGGRPGLRVSWQVTGIRHDPWAEANRLPVEVAKPEEERGTYLVPALYGQPREKELGYTAPEPVPLPALPNDEPVTPTRASGPLP